MAREECSFNQRIMAADETAALESVAAGEEYPPKPKRKAEEAAEPRSTKKRQVEAAAVAKGEEAPAKKMTRLPHREVAWILAQEVEDDRCVRPEVRELRHLDRDLWPSREEESDSYAAARVFIEIEDKFFKHQAWVRSQYIKHGYVEVDDDFLADRAQVRAWCEEARDEAFKDLDFSGGDEDLKEFFMNLW
uniref:Uncharacterized protein n=1 Tax=Avena sativa TaxID=4498 RepID=A0ACD6A046_AVESA